jgi:superfamily II RNA helicase
MSGRAGRRNIDTIGHVILLTNLFDPPEANAYHKLLYSPPKILKSKFKLGYSLVLHNKDKDKDDLIDFANKSLMSKDILNQISYSETKMKEITEEIEKYNIDKDMCLLYQSYKEQLPFLKNSKRTQIVNLLKQIEKDVPTIIVQMVKYDSLLSLESELDKNKKNKEYAETYISNQVNNIYSILNENGFFEEKNIAKSINEIHPLVFTDLLIQYNWFEKYSSSDIFSILSCFYDIKVQDEYKLFKPTLLKDELNYFEIPIVGWC